MTAVSAEGSIWRATRRPRKSLRDLPDQYAATYFELEEELPHNDHGAEIFMHARRLWLEKMGAITYSWQMTERVRQVIDVNVELIR